MNDPFRIEKNVSFFEVNSLNKREPKAKFIILYLIFWLLQSIPLNLLCR